MPNRLAELLETEGKTVNRLSGLDDPNVFPSAPTAEKPAFNEPIEPMSVMGPFDVWTSPADSALWRGPGARFTKGFGTGIIRATRIPALLGKEPAAPTTRAGKVGETAGAIFEGITELLATGGAISLIRGAAPKALTFLDRALNVGLTFGTREITDQARKGTAEFIHGEDVGYEGGTAVLEAVGFGVVFSLATSGVSAGGKAIWSKLKPSEQAKALKLLGLKRGASFREVVKTAQQKAAPYHPDKVKGAADKFKEIINARETLRESLKAKDVVKRVFKPKLITGEAPVGETALVRAEPLFQKLVDTPKPPAPAFAEKITPTEPTEAITPAAEGEPVFAEKPVDIVSPNLYIGNVTGRMRKVFGELFGKSPQDVKPFLEGAFPTKRAKIEVTREQAKVAADELEADIVSQFENNQIRTENELALANAQWGNVRELREAIGEKPGPRPFKVIRAEGQDMRIIKNTKARIWGAVQPSTLFDSGMTVQQVLQATMKKAEVASAKGWLEGARDIVAVHKDLARYANERLQGTDITDAERRRLLNFVARGRTPTEQAHAIAAVEILADKAEHRKQVNAFKSTVKDIRRRFRAGEVELGGLPDRTRNQVLSILQELDPTKMTEAKAEKLFAREDYIQRTAGTVAKAFDSLGDDVEDILQMPNARIRELERISKHPIKDLDTDEIKYVNQSLKDLIALNDKKWLIKTRMRATKLRDNIQASKKEINVRGVFQETKERIPTLKGLVTTQQSSLKTLFGSATGKENKATIGVYDNLVQANRYKAELKKKYLLSARKKVEAIGFKAKNWKGLQKKIKVTIGSKSRKVAIDELLPLYMHTKAEGNLKRILKTEGLNFTDFRGQKVSLPELRDILTKIPEKYKQFGDIYFELARERAKDLNVTSLKLENRQIARSKAYYPVSREREEIIGGKAADISTSIEQRGRYQVRTGGTGRINITPFSKEFMNSFELDSTYAAMTEALQDARVLVGNKPWRTQMKDSGRRRELNAITTMLKRIQGVQSENSIIEKEAGRWLGPMGKSILSARPSGMGVQIASIPAAYETIEPKYFIGLKQPTRGYIKKLAEQEPLLWMRWNAKQYNFVTGAAGQRNAFKTLVLGKDPATDKLLLPYTVGDQIAIGTIHRAATRKARAEGHEKGSEGLQKRAMDLTVKALDSQPQWDILHRTPLTSNPNALLRGSLMFMSARNAQYNVLLRARDDFKKGRISRFEYSKRVGGVVQANIQVSLARRIFKAGVKTVAITALAAAGIQEKPKEKIKEEMLREFKKVPGESIFNLLGLMAFGQLAVNIGREVISAVKFEQFPKRFDEIQIGNIFADVMLDVTQANIDIALAVKYAASGEEFKSGPSKDEKKWKRSAQQAADTIAELISRRYGLPYSGPKADFYYPITTAAKPPKNAGKGVFKKQ